jgi:hypothetical protein
MSAGIFVFGLIVTGFVVMACWLIATGIRDERRDRIELESRQAPALDAAEVHPVATRADGRTVLADEQPAG